ncbi:enoyl-CoA hydratase/isomerase family protein [Brachymonas denitrificans]|jgi:enoyl-CoA hydratase/carnithine racemase|uniref:Enoyl-CoA hydratase/carnithine racemase n=1 Tax=Brachymonas denitrificans DSM 15123 TaxID=1121117 RepID=A0A1H8H8W4_9BURK|nr:enoyl-CoA hydratase/isomerase family protein [Brachymonas denitrificans]SEN52545.1 Enoyl-CoA hydratase/carnithine racemase [Brachymonas denitrificans DSM 15123]
MAEVLCLIDETPGARHASVTLRHTGKFNAMSRGMWEQLQQVFTQLQREAHAEDPLRCVVVQGAEGHFCSGGDIAEYSDFRFDTGSLRHFHEELVWGGLSAVLACDAPVIAAIEGNCMGAGVEIASCCDIRVATRQSRYGAPIAKLGFPMAPREAALVAGVLGPTLARSMLLEAAVYQAPDMVTHGYLTRVVEGNAELRQDIQQSVARILQLSPSAARLHKQMMREWLQAQEDMLLRQCSTAYDYADSEEHREGIGAFLEKRPARF